MTEAETRALARTAAVLLLVSAGRYAWELRTPPPAIRAVGDDLSALIAESRRLAEDGNRRERPLGPAERVDPNRAPEAELDRLPGVGPGTARAIVASRESEGPFAAADDLLRVRGIGASTLARMRPHLEIEARPGNGRPVSSVVPARAGLAEPLLDLNRATEAELDRLPGVGPVIARRIVEARRARGGFEHPEDLLQVRGIGEATLTRIRPSVTVGPW